MSASPSPLAGEGQGGGWPTSKEELERLQLELAELASRVPEWTMPRDRPVAVAGAFIAYRRGVYGVGGAGDDAWAAAVEYDGDRPIALARLQGQVGSPYIAGYLALREGPLLERVIRQLIPPPDVILLDSTGLDHPRRAGLALHLGCVLGVPTVGVTDRPLVASVEQPGLRRGEKAPLKVGHDVLGYALRTQDGVKPVLVHAGWRTSPQTAAEVVLALSRRVRTPEPLREARRLAKEFRSTDRQLS